MGFEKQSQYVSGLLAELQEKDGALLCQGEELRRCIQELDALKEKITGEYGGAGRKKDTNCKVEIEGLMEDGLDSLSPLEPLSSRKTDFSVTSNPNEASDVMIQPHDFVGSERTLSINGGAVCNPNNGQALVVASRPPRQHEDQVLKQSTQTRILSDSGCVVLSTMPSVSHDITSEMGHGHDEIINKLQTQVSVRSLRVKRILTFLDIVKLKTSLTMHFFSITKCSKVAKNCNYSTTQVIQFHRVHVRTTLKMHCFSRKGAKLWNELTL